MMTSNQSLREARRKGIVPSDEKLSEMLSSLTPEWQILEITLLKLEQRQNASEVFGKFRKEAKGHHLNSPEQQAACYLIEAIVRNRLGQPQHALSALRKAHALKQSEIDVSLRVDILREQGQIYAWQGNSEAAISKYLLALNVSQRENDIIGEALTWATIARLYLEVLASQRAIYYFESAIDVIGSWQDSRERLRLLKDIAEAQLNLDEHEKALITIASIDADELSAQDDYLQFLILGIQLQCQTALQHDNQALKTLTSAFIQKVDDNDAYQVAHRDFILGNIAVSQKDADACTLLSAALKYYSDNNLTVPAWKTNLQMVQAYHTFGEIEESVAALEHAVELAISIRSPLLHEKTLMLQKELNISHIIEVEQHTTISENSNSTEHGYSILKTLGTGAFGVVYHAYDVLRDKDVALKKFDLKQIYDSRRREAVIDNIRRELKATSQIDHPGILKPIAYGNDNAGEPYVVMPLIQGQSLRQWLQTKPEPDTVINLLSKVCFALAAAHQANVVHRDLKPDNIMLTDEDKPVIVDFGISSFEPDERDPARAVGTLPYMAPEHHRGADANSAMDVFAMGIILFESLSGQWPWPDRCPEGAISYAFSQKKNKSHLNDLDLPNGLTELVIKMLSRNPKARPDAEIVAVELAELSK